MLRGILIVILVSALTAGAYMIRTQSQTIASLRSDIDAANQAVSILRTQVSALQMAYQTRDTLRQEADNVSSQRMQILETANSDWADCLLPADIGGMFSTKAGIAGDNSGAAGQSDAGNAASGLDAANK